MSQQVGKKLARLGLQRIPAKVYAVLCFDKGLPANNSDRLAVIYRILNKLIFFTPAALCDMPAEFVIAPLPAKRQLWEATNAQEWKSQSQNEPLEQVSYGLAVDGEIVKLDHRRLTCRDAWLPHAPSDEDSASQDNQRSSNRSADWWKEWCSSMDSMGGLIMLAATMV
jgi:hypothetical protein